MSSTTGPAATTTNSNSNGDAAASESAEASPSLAPLMASAASGDDAEGVELSMAFSGTETKQESGKQLEEQQPKVGNGEIGHDDDDNVNNVNNGYNGDGEDDDDDAGTTATAHECCVDDDDGCDADDTKNVPSILPPLTPEVYEEYRRDQELAEEARQKAKLMSMRTVHICGVPWCMCLPLLLLIIAVILGTIFAVLNYNESDSLQPPSFAPTLEPTESP